MIVETFFLPYIPSCCFIVAVWTVIPTFQPFINTLKAKKVTTFKGRYLNKNEYANERFFCLFDRE